MKAYLFFIYAFLSVVVCSNAQTNTDSKFSNQTYKNISFIIPQGFEKNEIPDKAGFIHKGSASSIIVSISENTPFTINYYTPASLKMDNSSNISMINITTVSGAEAVLYTYNYQVSDQKTGQMHDFESMVLFTGNSEKNICMVCSYPMIVKKLIADAMKTSLLSVNFNQN